MAVLDAAADEVMHRIVVVLFREFPAEIVGQFFRLDQRVCQMRVHLRVAAAVIVELPVIVQEAVRHDQELQLFVCGILDPVVAHLCERRSRRIHEAEDRRAGFFRLADGFHDLHGRPRDGGEDDDASLAHAAVARRVVFRGQQVVDPEGRAFLHVGFRLHRGRPGASDAEKIKVFKSLPGDLVHDLFDAGPQGQCVLDAAALLFFVEFDHSLTCLPILVYLGEIDLCLRPAGDLRRRSFP